MTTESNQNREWRSKTPRNSVADCIVRSTRVYTWRVELVLGPAATEDLSSSDGVFRPSRILATPVFKVNDRHRSELTANSFSRGCQRSSTRKITNSCARFPSARLLVTPEFRIPLAPAASQRNSQCPENLQLKMRVPQALKLRVAEMIRGRPFQIIDRRDHPWFQPAAVLRSRQSFAPLTRACRCAAVAMNRWRRSVEFNHRWAER